MKVCQRSAGESYSREALEQRVWPVMTHGLRDYLIRVAEDDGALIRDATDRVAALVAALGAHAEEAAWRSAATPLSCASLNCRALVASSLFRPSGMHHRYARAA